MNKLGNGLSNRKVYIMKMKCDNISNKLQQTEDAQMFVVKLVCNSIKNLLPFFSNN